MKQEKKKQNTDKVVWFALAFFIFLFGAAVTSALADDVTPSSTNLEINHGETQSFNFRLTPSNQSDFTLYDNSIFDLNYPTSFSNLGTFTDIEVNVSVPKNFKAGNYSSKIYAQGDSQTSEFTINLNVPQDLDVVFTEQNNTFSSGTKGVFDLILTNDGNVDAKVSLSSSEIFKGEYEEVSLLRGQSTNFGLVYNISSNTTPGQYSTLMNFTLNENTQNYNFTYTVEDKASPLVSFYNETVYDYSPSVKIRLSISDNIGIDNATYEWNNQTYVLEEAEEYWIATIDHTDLSITSVSLPVTVTDVNDNIMTKSLTVDFTQPRAYEILEYSSIEIIKDKSYVQDIVSFNKDFNYSVKLDKYTWDASVGNSSREDIEIFIDSNNERFTLNDNESQELSSQYILKLGLKGKVEGHISGTLLIEIPDYIGEDIEYKFATKIGDQEINNEITTSANTQFGLAKRTCRYIETDNFNYYPSCETIYPEGFPIGSTGFILDDNSLDILKKGYSLEVEKEAERADTWMALFLLSFILLLGGVGTWLVRLGINNGILRWRFNAK